MRRVAAWVVVGAGAVGGTAAAQQPVVVPSQPAFQMPGAAVGKPLLQPVGAPLPTATSPVGTGPGGIPPKLNPLPNGQQFDPRNVVAPYPGMPKPPPSIFEVLEQKWASLFQSDAPAVRPVRWTPGLSRRNKARAEERRRWMWD